MNTGTNSHEESWNGNNIRPGMLAALAQPLSDRRFGVHGVHSSLKVFARLLLAAAPTVGWQVLGARGAHCMGMDVCIYACLDRSPAVSMQFISPNVDGANDEEQPMIGQLFDPDFGDEFDGESLPMMYLHDSLDDDDDDDYDEEPTSPAVVSPFASETGAIPQAGSHGTYALTIENVESALDEVRPYLQADGGDVKLREIDGPDVVLELEGACAGCISSAMTMRMGIEKKLRERIPEIAEVRQMLPETVELSIDGVDTVLDDIRPFITIADKNAKLEVVDIGGPDISPIVTLRLVSKVSVVKSVQDEIRSRIQTHFSQPGLRIEWEGAP